MNLLSTTGFTVGARVGNGPDKQSTFFSLSQRSFTPWLKLARHQKILGPCRDCRDRLPARVSPALTPHQVRVGLFEIKRGHGQKVRVVRAGR